MDYPTIHTLKPQQGYVVTKPPQMQSNLQPALITKNKSTKTQQLLQECDDLFATGVFNENPVQSQLQYSQPDFQNDGIFESDNVQQKQQKQEAPNYDNLFSGGIFQPKQSTSTIKSFQSYSSNETLSIDKYAYLSLQQQSFDKEKDGDLKTFYVHPVSETLIGRNRKADVILPFKTISRKHGVISFLNNQFYYTSTSHAGSYRKLQPGESLKIEQGITLEIGENEFEVINLNKGQDFTTKIVYGMKQYIDKSHLFKLKETIGSSQKLASYCLEYDPKLEAQHGIFDQDGNGNFWYQDTNSKRGTFQKMRQNQTIKMKNGQYLKFSDNLLFLIQIGPLKDLLKNSPTKKCQVCQKRNFSHISYPCLDLYCCGNCYQNYQNNQCPICKKIIERFEVAFSN